MVTVAVIRHPADRLLSTFSFVKSPDTWTSNSGPKRLEARLSPYQTVNEWVSDLPKFYRRKPLGLAAKQCHFLCFGNRRIPDRLIEFSNLQAEWSEIAAEFGLPTDLPVLHKTNHDKWQNVFSEQELRVIRSVFAKDFELGKYE